MLVSNFESRSRIREAQLRKNTLPNTDPSRTRAATPTEHGYHSQGRCHDWAMLAQTATNCHHWTVPVSRCVFGK